MDIVAQKEYEVVKCLPLKASVTFDLGDVNKTI